MTSEQLQMFSFSPNALWSILGCEVDRVTLPWPKPWRPVRTVTDKFGRVICCHVSGDAGYEYELSVARWLLFGTAQDSILDMLHYDYSFCSTPEENVILMPTIVRCGGCGETDPNKRCFGCLHNFYGGNNV